MAMQKGETFNYPKNWADITIEIDRLLRKEMPAYEKKVYITPGLYIGDIKINPDGYPLLHKITTPMQKRYISYFLRDSGRKSVKLNRNSQVWMLPEEPE